MEISPPPTDRVGGGGGTGQNIYPCLTLANMSARQLYHIPLPVLVVQRDELVLLPGVAGLGFGGVGVLLVGRLPLLLPCAALRRVLL